MSSGSYSPNTNNSYCGHWSSMWHRRKSCIIFLNQIHYLHWCAPICVHLVTVTGVTFDCRLTLSRTAEVMEEADVEQQEPLRRNRDEDRKKGCCERLHLSISKWMLPEDHREKYLERANCCPPPIFIILISMVEVGQRHKPLVHRFVWGVSQINSIWGCLFEPKTPPPSRAVHSSLIEGFPTI